MVQKVRDWYNKSLSSTYINPAIKTARYVFLELSVCQLLILQVPKMVHIFLGGENLERWKPLLTKKCSIIPWYKTLNGSWILEIKVLS